MAERVYPPEISPAADADITHILEWSLKHFGEAAVERYQDLLIQAIHDVAEDPVRPGSKERSEIAVAGARTYHLNFSRDRVAHRPYVRSPRHFLLYRRRADGRIEIARILHDSRDLKRHLPEEYKLL